MSDQLLNGGRQMGALNEQQEIASDQLDSLREHPSRCAWLSVRAGRHPWVRWSETREAYEIVERTPIDHYEVSECSKGDLLNLFAENPADVRPQSDPYSEDVWSKVESGDDDVIYADGRPE